MPRCAAAARPGCRGGVTAAELFQGEVKISADKATNSLVVVASQSDYRNLVRVIEKLDMPRRQVFIEAVIMEVDLDRQTDVRHQPPPGLHGEHLPGAGGGRRRDQVRDAAGVPPSFSLDQPRLATAASSPACRARPSRPSTSCGSHSRPSASCCTRCSSSSDVNVLSTPHLLTSDNEEAEITVGQNVPFQAGFAPQLLDRRTGDRRVPSGLARPAPARCSAASARTTRRSTARTSS